MIAGVPERGQAAPNVLGKYRLIAELGRGGMADVYLALAHDSAGHDAMVVIKRLRPHLADEPELLAMFQDEARLAAKLHHDNVVRTYEVGEADGEHFIVMEYLEGQPLNRILRRCKSTLTTPMAIRILCGALDGLHHAHELVDADGSPLSVVHRDATPHNIFITYDGHTKVVDFGIAKAAISVAETRSGVLKGKVTYMAPEQARGDGVDRRADLFSIGCCLWESLTGRRVWKGKSDIQILNAIMGHDEAIPSPDTVDPTIDKRLAEICNKALAFDPDQRHSTAIALRDHLTAYLASIGDNTRRSQTAAVVCERFRTENDKLRIIIERQVESAAATPHDEYDKLAIPRLGERPQSLASLPQAEDLDPDHTPSRARHRIGPRPVISPRDDRTGRLPIAATALIIIASVFVGVLLWRDRGTPVPPQGRVPAPTVPDSTQAPTAVSDEVPARIALSVTVKPASARIFIDNEIADGNPTAGTFPRDDRFHTIRAEAAGYMGETRTVSFANNLTLELVLTPIEPKPTPRTPAPVAVKPDPPLPPVREIDDTNPYR